MKIAIIGYGKMGRAIEEIALQRGHEVALKISSTNAEELNQENLKEIDAAIEFSMPKTAIQNIEICLNASTPVVIGTTGWYHEHDRILALCAEKKTAMLAATNFSVGVNLFFELNQKLAQLMAPREEYRASMEEIHHTEKLDSPSGTAITLAEGLINAHPNYQDWVNEKEADSNVLPILSIREDKVPGTHSINYESEIDSIYIKHTAKNRKGFALGAVLAAEFIHNKQGVFSMKEVLNF